MTGAYAPFHSFPVGQGSSLNSRHQYHPAHVVDLFSLPPLDVPLLDLPHPCWASLTELLHCIHAIFELRINRPGERRG